jgi:pimeloyl-ACP methyl ester carboxylesterase
MLTGVKVVFVHGACVRDGAWWWRHMTEPLAARGHTTEAVELPSCGPAMGDLYADSDAVRAALDRTDDEVILCGHSYGGHVITDAATHPAVRALVYIATVTPDPTAEPSPWLTVEDGKLGVNPAIPPDLLFHDAPEAFPEALKRTTWQSLTAHTQTPRTTPEHPSTYVICTEDRWTPPTHQRAYAQQTTRTLELPTGHHPFISHPHLLAQTF